MDGSITDDQAHEWLQDIADNGWISLHFDNPALGGVDRAEISGGGYNRIKMPFSRPQNRAIWSLRSIEFAGLNQNKISHFGIWNAEHRGKLRAYGEFRTPHIVLTGGRVNIKDGDLAITIG